MLWRRIPLSELLLPKSHRVLHPKVLIQLIDNQIMYRALTCKNLRQLPLGKYVSQMKVGLKFHFLLTL